MIIVLCNITMNELPYGKRSSIIDTDLAGFFKIILIFVRFQRTFADNLRLEVHFDHGEVF